MDSVVEKIAREVMLKLKSESADRGSSYSVPSQTRKSQPARTQQNSKVAVLLTTNYKVIDQVLGQISNLLPANGKLIVSSYIYENYGQEKIGGNVTLLHSKNVPSSRALDDVTHLIIPSLSLNSLGKTVNLISDTYATQVISNALCAGIQITVTDESIINSKKYFTIGVSKRIEEFKHKLEEMGIIFRSDSSLKLAPISECVPCSTGSCSPLPATRSNNISKASAPVSEMVSNDSPLFYGTCVAKCATKVQEVINAGAERVEKGLDAPIPSEKLARYIDHTLLKANATKAEITKLCDEARQYHFASVCVNPGNVALAASLLEGSDVAVCTVIGFPLGATSTFAKVMETRDAVANGATEIDMVINVGALKSKDYEMVKNDISRVAEATGGNILKVILETALLTDEEKVKACELAKLAGADFVKTSTGFSSGGATLEDVCLMRETVGPNMGVKASGGVRDAETAQRMIAIGATRIGASASIAIVKGDQSGEKGY